MQRWADSEWFKTWIKLARGRAVGLLVAALIGCTAFAATNELVLEWTHPMVPKVMPGFDPAGDPVIVTNPPIHFFFYVSTNLTNWVLLATATDTNRAAILLDCDKPQFVTGCASNSVYGVSKFGEVHPVPPSGPSKDLKITK